MEHGSWRFGEQLPPEPDRLSGVTSLIGASAAIRDRDIAVTSRPHNGSVPGARLIAIAACIAITALAACTSSGTGSLLVSNHTQVYRDSSGWSLRVPAGWHARQFSVTKDGITSAGVQLSNVKLPTPSLVPGYPVQVSNRLLPTHGIGLIIATDPDPKLQRGPFQRPPLPAPNGRYWNVGSSVIGTPYMETLWFRTHGRTLIACAKVGPKTTSQDLRALAAIIRSLH